MTDIIFAEAVDWAAVREDYEADAITLKAIQHKHGVSEARLRWAIKTRDWQRRNLRAVGRAHLITRMFRVLEHQIMALEKNMAGSGEGEAALLGKLATTLEKLIDIEHKTSGKSASKQGRDIADIRIKLIKRIEQLRKD